MDGENPKGCSARQWIAFSCVAVIFLLGVVLVFQHHWRKGSVAMGAALVVAGLLRCFLPKSYAGLLAVRSVVIDAAIFFILGVAMIVLGMWVPGVYQ